MPHERNSRLDLVRLTGAGAMMSGVFALALAVSGMSSAGATATSGAHSQPHWFNTTTTCSSTTTSTTTTTTATSTTVASSTTQASTTTGGTSTTVESVTTIATTTSTPVTQQGSTPTSGSTTVAPTTATGPTSGTLPFTGSSSLPLAFVGLVLTGAGLGLLVRRRRWFLS